MHQYNYIIAVVTIDLVACFTALDLAVFVVVIFSFFFGMFST